MRKLMIIMLVLVLSIGGTVEAASYPEWRPDAPIPERPHLTRSGGTFPGPNGKETWYNLRMGTCINIMRDLGYSVEEYPYWVREDGAKMLGEYVMCGANLTIRPKGTIIETSMGMAIVADRCERAYTENIYILDMAVDW